MPKDPSEHAGASAKGGVLLFLAGAAIIASAFLHPALQLKTGLYGFSGAVVQVATGAGLAFVGSAWALYAFTRPPPPRASIEAHIAFKNRMKAERKIDENALKAAPGIAQSAPQVKAMSEKESLDLAIRDCQLRLGKAKVMLGTGKLSKDGYKTYVTELQKELSDLEARRVKLEFRPR